MRVLAGISPILYHITSTDSVVGILRTDRFELKPSEGTTVEEGIKSRTYYLSTARTLMSKYLRANEYPRYSILVLDGRKLAANLKGAPVDYWGPDMRMNGENFESEDRIFSDSPFIEQAHKYITAIHSLIDPIKISKYGKQDLFQLQLKAKLRKIPTFFYDNRKAFALLDERRAITLSKGLLDPKEVPEQTTDLNSLSDWLALWEMPKSVYERLKLLPEREQQRKGLTTRMHRCVRMAAYYPTDVNSFLADLHIAKSIPYGTAGKEREALDRLIEVMRKNKLTPKQFYKALGDKFRST